MLTTLWFQQLLLGQRQVNTSFQFGFPERECDGCVSAQGQKNHWGKASPRKEICVGGVRTGSGGMKKGEIQAVQTNPFGSGIIFPGQCMEMKTCTLYKSIVNPGWFENPLTLTIFCRIYLKLEVGSQHFSL